MNCRFCSEKLERKLIDLGSTPIANDLLKHDQLHSSEPQFPLIIWICSKCDLVQTQDFELSSNIFSIEYPYFSSYSTSWLAHASDFVNKMIPRFGLNKESSRIVEVGSNDGYLLQYFNELGFEVLGIEPTLSTAKISKENGIPTINEFFGLKLSRRLFRQKKSSLLVANNVIAHVPDLNDFVSGLKYALDQTGILSIEFQNLTELLRNGQFDTLYHEHFSYFSLTSINNVLEAHGLRIFDFEELGTHGGSLRVFCKHVENKKIVVNPIVLNGLEEEKKMDLLSNNSCMIFRDKALKVKDELKKFISHEKEQGKKIAAYGAAAKGNTLLNYCDISSEDIICCADKNDHKQGLYLPGSGIPIVSPEEMVEMNPDSILILPWNLKEEILGEFTHLNSIRFLTAIPSLTILNN